MHKIRLLKCFPNERVKVALEPSINWKPTPIQALCVDDDAPTFDENFEHRGDPVVRDRCAGFWENEIVRAYFVNRTGIQAALFEQLALRGNAPRFSEQDATAREPPTSAGWLVRAAQQQHTFPIAYQ
jgi:hypothetical protein